MTQPTDKPTPEDIVRWRALAEAATAGIWRINPLQPHSVVADDGRDTVLVADVAASNEADADFIAAAREAVPRLCDALASAEAENAKLRAEVERHEPEAPR
jgi:hypothetical protein